jgi:8-oxo-dGTP pyrophosphatase MutT (NUDIX family)
MNDTDLAALPPATPAATLVLFRDSVEGPPELLVVERSGDMSFAAGAIVFPGGRLDDDDHALASDPARVVRPAHIDEEEAAARIAAIRETIEESGIAVGFAQHPEAATLTLFRHELAGGTLFSTLLEAHDFVLDLDVLIPFARWRPNFKEARVFDTRFYIARIPADAPTPVVDATENVRTFWSSARSLLDAANDGRVHVIFPTRRNLERLAQFGSYDEAARHAEDIPVRLLIPFIEERDGVRHLCIPDDLGYPVTSEVLSNVKRGFKS